MARRLVAAGTLITYIFIASIPSCCWLLLQNRIQAIAKRESVSQAHTGNFEASSLGHGAQCGGRKVVDMIRPAEAAPAGAAQVTVPAIVIRYFDDDVPNSRRSVRLISCAGFSIIR